MRLYFNKNILSLLALLLVLKNYHSYGNTDIVNSDKINEQLQFNENFNLENDGFINVKLNSNTSNTFSVGNGILSTQEVGNIKNNFLISGYIYGTENTTQIEKSGNGLFQYNTNSPSVINFLSNHGFISGYLQATPTALFKGIHSGNGIINFSNNSTNIKQITNDTGVIAGYLQITSDGSQESYGTGNAIISTTMNSLNTGNQSSKIENITNSGYIKGKGNGISETKDTRIIYSSNGIASIAKGSSSLDNIVNTGAIVGTAETLGIFSQTTHPYDRTDQATSFIKDSGNGIVSVSNPTNILDNDVIDTSVGKVQNNGYIKGSAKAIVNNSNLTPDSGYEDKTSYIHGSGNGISNSSDRSYGSTGQQSSKLSASIENISNIGTISGYAKAISGNSTIGSSAAYLYISGNGISNRSNSGISKNDYPNIKNINNNGLISGYAYGEAGEGKTSAFTNLDSSGNGIISRGSTDALIETIVNSGTISGYAKVISKEFINANTNSYNKKDYERIHFSGNGVGINGLLSKDNIILNSGVIKGSQAAISLQLPDPNIAIIVTNHGILAGREIMGKGSQLIRYDTNDDTKETSPDLRAANSYSQANAGVYIQLNSINLNFSNSSQKSDVELDNELDVLIKNITFGDEKYNLSGKKILNVQRYEAGNKPVNVNANAAIDSYLLLINDDNSYSNYIFNGAGIKKGVLTLENDNQSLNLNSSIVNAYKTAIKITGNNSTFISENTTLNGGGLENKNPIIEIQGSGSNTEFKNSIINGDVFISGDNGNIYLTNNNIINGNIISTENKNNSLYLGDQISENTLNIFHDIKNFKNITTNGKVTLFETAKIEGNGDINLNQGILLVRLDGSERDNKGRVTGHALYTHSGKINIGEGNSDNSNLPEGENHPDIIAGAKLFFKASGLGTGTVISMNGTDISHLDDEQLGTYSIAHTARKFVLGQDDHLLKTPIITPFILPDTTTDVVIDVKKLDDIIDTDEVENKEDLDDIWESIIGGEQDNELLPTTEGEIDAKKEFISILDQIYANNPYAYVGPASRANLLMFSDKIFNTKMPKYQEWIVEAHQTYNHMQFPSIEQTNRFNSIYQTNKYTSNLKSYGFLGTAEYGIAENSSLGFALGGTKQYLKMSKGSKFDANLGYIGIYAKRNIDNLRITAGAGYQYGYYDVDRILSNRYQYFKNDGQLSTDSLGLYLEGRYFINLNKTTTLQPKIRFSYTAVDQKRVKEDKKPLSIDVDKHLYRDTYLELGADLVKKSFVKNAILEMRAGLSYIRNLNTDREYLTARIKNSSDFKIKGVKQAEDNLKLLLGIDYERTNGMFYNFYTELESDRENSHNINLKVGIGYRF